LGALKLLSYKAKRTSLVQSIYFDLDVLLGFARKPAELQTGVAR